MTGVYIMISTTQTLYQDDTPRVMNKSSETEALMFTGVLSSLLMAALSLAWPLIAFIAIVVLIVRGEEN